MTREAYVFEAIRTPRGRGDGEGALSTLSPVELVRVLFDDLRARGLDPAGVDDVVLGCVEPVGDRGINVARNAVLRAGWPDSIPGMTVQRGCASGLDAIGAAAARVMSGVDDLIIAGGVESMSRAVEERGRFGPMGLAADLLANLDDKSREALDQWALRSHVRAAAGWEHGSFARGVVPVRREDEVLLARDELIQPDISMEQLAELPTAASGAPGEARALVRFPELGGALERRHSAATAPVPADGAALVVVGDAAIGAAMGLKPIARVRSYATVATDPILALGAPAPATRRAVERAHLELSEINLFEVHEAFSATALRYVDELGIDEFRVNVHGGAIAMGHPVGSSGAILVGTLIDTLAETDDNLGVAALSAGDGLGAALVVERA
jgi:acetyl-CoA C-acetyltransferase